MSMRYFKVNVNGVSYDVAIEEVASSQAQPDAAAAPAPVTAPEEKLAASAAVKVGDTVVNAPLRASVVKIIKAEGDKVSSGDTVCVLEAMKMEYDVVAPCDGVVSAIFVKRGTVAEEGKPVFAVRN